MWDIYSSILNMVDITKNKKYKALLDTSKDLFWKYGFRRVTIDEICREAKTSKMTFYRFFPNKLELARAIIDKVTNESMSQFREIANEDSSPTLKMKKMLNLKLEGTNNISPEFLKDFYNNPDLGLSDYLEKKSKSALSEIINIYKEGQKKGWIRKDLNVDFLIYFIKKTTPLVSDDELLKLYNSPQDLIMELTNFFIYGILPIK